MAFVVALIIVVVLVAAAGGVWYYKTHDNRSVSSVSNSNTSTATIISAASAVSGFQNSIVGSDFKIVNATSGDLLWIDQDGTPIDVHIQNGLSFEGLPITVSTTPEINYASTSPEIAYSLAPMLVNSIDNYMNLHGFVLQTDQSTNETHPLIRYYEFSNAYYDAQTGVRCRTEIWPNIGPDGLSLDIPTMGIYSAPTKRIIRMLIAKNRHL